MARKLVATVYVGDQAYGPRSDVPDDVAALITNPAAWADDATEDAPPADVGEDDGGHRHEEERAELEALSKAELLALAEARQIEVPRSASKGEIIDALSANAAG